MITERELLQAIRECERDPITYNSCEKLANFYVIYDHLFGTRQNQNSPRTEVERVAYTRGNSEFLRAVDGAPSEEVWFIMDELVEVVQTLHPRVYDSVIDRLKSLPHTTHKA